MENTVLVSGFAETPKGTPLYETYKYTGVILLIDRDKSRIVESDFRVISPLTNKTLQRIVNGFYLKDPFDSLKETLDEGVSIPSKKAIIRALKSAIDRYNEGE